MRIVDKIRRREPKALITLKQLGVASPRVDGHGFIGMMFGTGSLRKDMSRVDTVEKTNRVRGSHFLGETILFL